MESNVVNKVIEEVEHVAEVVEETVATDLHLTKDLAGKFTTHIVNETEYVFSEAKNVWEKLPKAEDLVVSDIKGFVNTAEGVIYNDEMKFKESLRNSVEMIESKLHDVSETLTAIHSKVSSDVVSAEKKISSNWPLVLLLVVFALVVSALAFIL